MSATTATYFPPSRAEGLRRLQNFVGRAGKYYADRRNYDFGPNQRQNVSGLSPYHRHRLVTEEETLRSVLSQHSYEDASKFIEEVCWRTYWKGWLQQRPGVWTTYVADCAKLKEHFSDNPSLKDRYKRAISGTTQIKAFDFWVHELKEYGYLHNHARMWFASIWIFTLGLPWVLGADFFFEHLLDGDPASNILSWRWVAGLQTRGKPYLAKAENIHRFTSGRFNPQNQLKETPPHLDTLKEEPLVNITYEPVDARIENKNKTVLLITEEDLSPELWCLPKSALQGIVGFAPTTKPISLSQKVYSFRQAAVRECLQRCQKFYAAPTFYLEEGEETRLLSLVQTAEVSEVLTAFVPVGPTRERLQRLIHGLGSSKIKIIERMNVWDQLFWPHTKAGYFMLKSRIRDILENFRIL